MLTLLAFTAHALAAPVGGDTLRGRIVDGAGHAIPGATVTITELDRTVTASRDGNFAVADLPDGEYTVVVRRMGFQSFVAHVSLHGNANLDPTLTESALRLADVTVTATRSPLDALSSPLPVSSPAPEQLRREQSISLAHTIDGLPGVRSLTTGQQTGKPVIRGFGGSRVLVLQNGLRLEDYSWSDEDGPSVDARLASRVEVIRGPASLLYGSDAIGGVVNVIPAPIPESVAGIRAVRGGAEATFGTNAQEVNVVLRGEGAHGGFGWRATAIGRGSQDLHTPDGALKNTKYGAANGQIATGWHGEWGSAAVRYDHFGGEFHLLEANAVVLPGGGADAGPERKTSDDRVQLELNLPLGKVRLEPKLQWQRHWLAELEDIPLAGGGFVEDKSFDLTLSTITADLLAHTDIAGRVRTTFGVSGIAQNNESRPPDAGFEFVPNAKINTVAGFAVGQMALGRVSLLGGARIDHRRLSSDSSTQLELGAREITDDAFSGNIGAVLPVSASTAIAVNVGRAWRAPNLLELFANGPLLSEGIYLSGQNDLVPERSTNVDLGVRWSASRARVEASVYDNLVSNYIFLAPTGERKAKVPGSPDTLDVYRFEAADAVLYGAELGAEFDATSALTLRGRYDFVRGTNDEADTPLPLMPPPRIDFDVELHSPNFRGLGRSFVRVGVEVEREQTHLEARDFATDAYTLLDIGAGFESRILGRTLQIDVRVHNALDENYRSFLSRYKSFALNPGRDVVIRISTN